MADLCDIKPHFVPVETLQVPAITTTASTRRPNENSGRRGKKQEVNRMRKLRTAEIQSDSDDDDLQIKEMGVKLQVQPIPPPTSKASPTGRGPRKKLQEEHWWPDDDDIKDFNDDPDMRHDADLEPVDINSYQRKKTLAEGMLDMALLSANTNQLRFVLETPSHTYYSVSVTFIIFSIILQIVVGMTLLLVSRYNVKDENDIRMANKLHNFLLVSIFLITVVNVFVSTFSVAGRSKLHLLTDEDDFDDMSSNETDKIIY